VSYFHVLEHLYDIDRALAEAARVLKPGGALLVEVPDAPHYFTTETVVGPMFWLGLKEHVNHFSPAALASALARNGFRLNVVDRSAQPMKGGKAYPSLLALATKDATDSGKLGESFDRGEGFATGFASHTDKMQQIAAEIAACAPGPVAFWGIGLEFFALYGYLAPLLDGREMRFLDSNPFKQGLKVDGRPVADPSTAPIEGTLVCCSYMAAPQIVEQALALGWKHEAIRCLA
jgi:SAM-dependent methyltransferase